jgi:hypothetical protein
VISIIAYISAMDVEDNTLRKPSILLCLRKKTGRFGESKQGKALLRNEKITSKKHI